MNIRGMRSLLIIFTIIFVAACGAEDSSDTETQSDSGANSSEEAADYSGGELQVAYHVQPQTLDPHMTTAQGTRDISRHIFETLVGLNENYEVEPLLAESFDVSDDGQTITFHLREGISFHDGTEMTADDVVASMDKWLGSSAQGRANFGGASFEKQDDSTVEMQLETPNFVALHILADAGQAAAIMPQEIAEDAEADGVDEFVGTGPFTFEEWAQDQHVHLSRFEDYQPVDDEPSGLVGTKEALVDDLYFNFVSDPSTRVTGIQTGEYDIAMEIPYDNVDQLESQPEVNIIPQDDGFNSYVFNKAEGVMSDQTMRQAVAAAIDPEGILTAAYTDPEYFELDPGLVLSDQTDWYSDVGNDRYNINDPEQAQQLMDEAGYDNEEITILTSRDYEDMYTTAVVLQQQLEEAGMNATLDVYDWPTLLDRREDPSAYDIFITNIAPRATPNQLQFLDSEAAWAGWTDSPEMDERLEAIIQSSSQEEALEHTEELQDIFWDYLPVLKTGNKSVLIAARDDIEGFDHLIGPIFWNTSRTE